MSAISQKSISGITSITTPAGVDNQFTLHTNNTNEVVKLDHAGNLHFSNHVNTTGVSTSSNFKTGSSNLHSTGLTVGDTFVHATGVNATSADIDDFIDVGNNIKLGNAGVITATSFVGDGSDLTNLPAGLGTALSSTQTNPLNKMYYTNQVLGIGATVTVDPPASAQAAYTQYADIKVDDDYDLIIAEGDDLIPDVLGLADFGTFGGGPSAGRIRVNSITNSAANGAPTVQNGLIISGITTITTLDLNGDLDVDGHTNLDNVNIAGVTTTGNYFNSVAGYRVANHPVVGYVGFTAISGGSYAATLGSTGTSTLRHTQIYGGGAVLATFDGVNKRLGIGTDAPAGMLEVQKNGVPAIIANYNNQKHIQMGAGGSGAGFHLTAGNFFTINHQPYADRGTDSNLTERFRITSAGKVNIGDNQMSSNLLNIEDGTAAALDIASHGTGGDTAYIGVKKSSGGGLTFGISNRDIIFKTGASYSSGTTFDSGTERLRITSGGKIGINNNSPTSQLDGANDLVIGDTSDADSGITLVTTTSGQGLIHFSDATSGNARYDGFIGYEQTSRALKFGTAQTERLRITSGGNLLAAGITTSNAGFQFGSSSHYLYQSASDTATLRITSDGPYVQFKDVSSDVQMGSASGTLRLSAGGVERLRIASDYITVFRENSSNEGGQIALARASDNSAYWMIDAYGSTSTPDFRLHAGGNAHFGINSSGQWVYAPPGTVIQVVHGRYDPNTDTYALISSDTKARSPAYVDITPLRSDSKLVIHTKCHTRMSGAPGCSYGIDYSTDSGSSWTALSGMNQRSGTSLDFFYKGESLNHHYTGSIITYIDSFSGSRRFSPWGHGWGSGTWELSYGHGEHSVTIFEIAT